jgi:hypothetical protein
MFFNFNFNFKCFLKKILKILKKYILCSVFAHIPPTTQQPNNNNKNTNNLPSPGKVAAPAPVGPYSFQQGSSPRRMAGPGHLVNLSKHTYFEDLKSESAVCIAEHGE